MGSRADAPPLDEAQARRRIDFLWAEVERLRLLRGALYTGAGGGGDQGNQVATQAAHQMSALLTEIDELRALVAAAGLVDQRSGGGA